MSRYDVYRVLGGTTEELRQVERERDEERRRLGVVTEKPRNWVRLEGDTHERWVAYVRARKQ